MRKWLIALTAFCGISFAGGLDFGVGVRNGPYGNFVGSLGAYLDGFPLDVRTNLVVGGPNGLILTAEALYTLPMELIVRPYVSGGVGAGITVRQGTGEITFSLGQTWYGFVSAGVQFPDRGYRPYLEVTQFVGADVFTLFRAGFVAQVRIL
ncbi:hypothetical protein [Calidithermus roseus]|uniref:Outer membrane protein beta-barrel domain protein n=1 Tax=Calidithermus roseus TaxID=1644118 RepID=A0A399F1F1_9DEIN|nr:hypothetical protein [Calidithermus roseus]RIH89099.1 hypothetical protein Mrose_00484 [Calidithermus roseus]